jgi:DNA repair exonuclease SbcCD ATPase subunit
MENPINRLNECMDILGCFEEGNCPDLRKTLEEQLLKEKVELEQLVEKVVETEIDYEMPIHQFREAAERNTAQGILLNEQVSDYKELCEGLAKRNQELKEENDRLNKKIRIKDKLSEKKIMMSNKEIVSTSSEAEKLAEQVETLTEKNARLIERTSKLALTNKEFEKENGVLNTKLKEAGQIMKGVKEQQLKEDNDKKKVSLGIKQLQEKIAILEASNKELTSNYENQSVRFDKLTESFANYKQEVEDTYNPVAHLVPKFEDRVGKYLNLRENRGIEVEAYWSDLLKNYGDNVKPFEDKIRSAKTLKEATSSFLKYRTQIDPDFNVAQPAEYAYRNRQERSQLYEAQGLPNIVEDYNNSSLEKKNEDFLANLHSQGLN